MKKSIRTRMIVSVISLMIITGIILMVGAMTQSKRSMNLLVDTVVNDQLQSDNKMLASYLKEEFGYSGEGDSVDFLLTNYVDEDFEDQLINYIFSPYILEYSFSDDCIGGEEIDRLEKDFDEVLQEFPVGAVGFKDSDRS